MLQHELTARVLPLVRPLAVLLCVLAVAMAVVRWQQTSRFLAHAQQGQGTVLAAYVAVPGRPLDARLATPHALWAAMWSWVEAALGFGLLAVYGRALVEDPLSVIGFKSWRPFGRGSRD